MDVFGALADPIRRDLLRQLASGSARVVDLAARHHVSRPAISRHLRVLSDAGLVSADDRGRERHYALEIARLDEVRRLLDELAPVRPPITGAHLDALATEVARTRRDRRRPTTTTSTPTTAEERSA